MTRPAISVVMPVCNGISYLEQSIHSILAQTFEDFELLILENGSTDGSRGALRALSRTDPRIRLHECAEALGTVASGNRIASHASAPLIARMDVDDVSHPDRLRRQWEVLRKDAGVVLVGTLADGIDADGHRARPRDRSRLLGSSALAPFPHGSSMFRRAPFEDLGGYRAACEPWEDQDLFWRMADRGRVVVLPDALYRYRYHLDATTLVALEDGGVRTTRLRDRCLAERRAGRDYSKLLERDGREIGPTEVTASALRSLGALRLWSGGRPGILRALLNTRVLTPRPSALCVLGWAVWGSLSPGSLRLALRGLIRARDRAASIRITGATPREWRFG